MADEQLTFAERCEQLRKAAGGLKIIADIVALEAERTGALRDNHSSFWLNRFA